MNNLKRIKLKPNLIWFTNSQKFRYLAIGGYNTIVGYIIFVLFIYFLGDVFHYLFIFTISFIISLTHAYIGQRFFVFRSTAFWVLEYIRFFIVNLSSMLLNAVLLIFFVEIGVELMLSQAISLIIVTIVSYYGHRNFSFKPSKY